MTKRELSSSTGLNFSSASLGLPVPHQASLGLPTPHQASFGLSVPHQASLGLPTTTHQEDLPEVPPAKLQCSNEPSPFNPCLVEDSNISNISGVDQDKHNDQPSFKNKNFQHSNKIGNKKKAWRTLKQILATEQSLPWPQDAVTYSVIDAPPSFRPAKKYSDISGLPAPYTDPQTKLNYAVAEEFNEIRKLPSDIVQGYLTLRKANTQLQ